MHYACPIWRFAARNHVRKLQVLQSKCLRIAIGASWYSGNSQIHEDLRVPFFADRIRSRTERFDPKLTGVGSSAGTCGDQGLTQVYQAPCGDPDGQTCRYYPSKVGHIHVMNRAHLHYSITLSAFSFHMLFSSAVRRMLGYNAQSRCTARTSLRHGGFTYEPTCLIFATSLTLDMTNLCSNPKAFQQKLCPRIEVHWLLSSGP